VRICARVAGLSFVVVVSALGVADVALGAGLALLATCSLAAVPFAYVIGAINCVPGASLALPAASSFPTSASASAGSSARFLCGFEVIGALFAFFVVTLGGVIGAA
jgi:hypothetical protein